MKFELKIDNYVFLALLVILESLRLLVNVSSQWILKKNVVAGSYIHLSMSQYRKNKNKKHQQQNEWKIVLLCLLCHSLKVKGTFYLYILNFYKIS